MNTPNHTWGDSPIHEQIRTMNDTPTPSLFATDGQRTTDAECWMNYCLEAEKELTAVTEQRDRLAEALRELCIVLLTDKSPDITDLLNKAGAAMAAVNYSTAKKSQP